jgi:hypothetical protein
VRVKTDGGGAWKAQHAVEQEGLGCVCVFPVGAVQVEGQVADLDDLAGTRDAARRNEKERAERLVWRRLPCYARRPCGVVDGDSYF